ncbi:MAG: hypothetical protein AAF500_19375 [Myxococcota bacterium]
MNLPERQEVMELRRNTISILASSLLLFVQTGCGDGGFEIGEPAPEPQEQAEPEKVEAVADADADGVPNAVDPTPLGSSANRIKSVHTGGSAKVVAITAKVGDEEASHLVQGQDLDAGCADYYEPQAALCDDDDSLAYSERANPFAGPSWRNHGSDVWGVLVIDACSDGDCEAIDFNEARVFQTYGYSKLTDLRLYVHPHRGDEPPAWDDAGWEVAVDQEDIGEGADPFGDGSMVGDPTVFVTGAQVTRYIRLEVANDGSHGGDTGSIDFRAIKLFSASVPKTNADTRRVFISSGTYDGNLGGIAGADEECQGLADASLRVSGTFKAWIAEADRGTERFERSDATYVRLDGAIVGHGFEALAHPQTPINIDQRLNRVPASKVWAGHGCEDFSSTSGMAGVSSTTTGFSVKSMESCALGGKRIYCVEQQ